MAKTLTNSNLQTAPDVHPDYAFEDADLVLVSSDRVGLRVHAVIMKMVSSVFRDMLGVTRTDGEGPVALEESIDTLSTMLGMVYPGKQPPARMTISQFRAVAVAAEKYDIACATCALKEMVLGKGAGTTLMSDSIKDTGATCLAVEEYFMAWDLGWKSVAMELSAKTLSCDLNSKIAQDLLFSSDVGAPAAMRLFALQRQRRMWIVNSLSKMVYRGGELLGTEEQKSSFRKWSENINSTVVGLHLTHATGCSSRSSDCATDHRWWRFKFKIMTMLETDASGTQLLADDFHCSDEVRALCRQPCCGGDLSANANILRKNLRIIVERVPNTLEGLC